MAIQNVTAQMESDILPQLRRLRRKFIGSADPDLPVTVPSFLWRWRDTRVWPRIESKEDDFVFEHNELDQRNILVDPETFRIVSIIDWEAAGFFPEDWELLKWKSKEVSGDRFRLEDEASRRQLIFLGPEFSTPADLWRSDTRSSVCETTLPG
ncbi:hypothetical protein SEPCBS57363_002277 [Sporothrix epigloea]|uniref:Aminoglycoside phosphotransferase domain-containing protein n=1 Tax=Sporothrix epigloea TaxID=1892477 RepID=A0ABP0DHN8_9PEZI